MASFSFFISNKNEAKQNEKRNGKEAPNQNESKQSWKYRTKETTREKQ